MKYCPECGHRLSLFRSISSDRFMLIDFYQCPNDRLVPDQVRKEIFF